VREYYGPLSELSVHAKYALTVLNARLDYIQPGAFAPVDIFYQSHFPVYILYTGKRALFFCKHREWVSTPVKPLEKSCLLTGIFRSDFCLVGRIPHPLLGEPKPNFKTIKNICKNPVSPLAKPYRPAVVVAKGTSPFPARRKGGEQSDLTGLSRTHTAPV